MATVAAVGAVPDWPWRHADLPVYWGIVGFVAAVAWLLAGSPPPGRVRGVARGFLVALPLVYVASWWRVGGSGGALAFELVGMAIWVGLAVASRRRDALLWAGCAAHALWDVVHYGRSAFIPDWYVLACLAADLGFAAFLLVVLSGVRGGPPKPLRVPAEG